MSIVAISSLLLEEFCRDIKFDSASLQPLTWVTHTAQSVLYKKMIKSILLNQSSSYLFLDFFFFFKLLSMIMKRYFINECKSSVQFQLGPHCDNSTWLSASRQTEICWFWSVSVHLYYDPSHFFFAILLLCGCLTTVSVLLSRNITVGRDEEVADSVLVFTVCLCS